MSKRAVLYARVSGDDTKNDGRNLQSQIEMCREYALGQGWTIVKELPENDRSGADFDLPMLNEALEMARVGVFDVLVTRELDRFARRLAKQLIVEGEFKRASVQCEYVLGDYPDTPEGRLNKHIRATIAEFEREKIAERMSRGRRNKVKAGYVMLHGEPPFGYRRVDVDGNQTLVINEEEAAVVRIIYEWYVNGDGENGPLSTIAVARRLTEQRVPTSGDKNPRIRKQAKYGQWGKTVVARLLRSETYAGVWHYGKQLHKKPKRPRDHWLPVKVPAIVDRKTWEAAQKRFEVNIDNSKRNLKHEYLLRRRVICGHCGAKMQVWHWKNKNGTVLLYYRCYARVNPDVIRECDLRNSFRADRVDAAVWAEVKALFEDDKALDAGLEKYRGQRENDAAPLRERLQAADAEIAKYRAKLERLLDLYIEGEFAREVLTERKHRLETTLGALERERSILAARLDEQTLTAERIQTIKELVKEIRPGLDEADEDFDERRRFIEMLDIQVRLWIEDGKRKAHIEGVIEKDLDIGNTSS